MVEQTADMTRWRGFTHKELYKLLNEGAGPAASADPSRRWSELASTLTEVGDDLRAAIGRSGSGWTGRAAGAAYDRLSDLVDWAQRTGGNATEMRTAVENQAEHLAKARAEMPVPDDAEATPAPVDPTTAPALQVLATQQDSEPVEAAASAGQQKAFEVMATYQRNTTANTGAMASFTAPAQLSGLGDVHRHHDIGVHLTTPAVSVGIGLGGLLPHEQDHGSPIRSDHGHHGGWSYQPTIGAGSPGGGGHETYRPGPYSGGGRPSQPTFTPGIWGVLGDESYGRGRTSTGTGGPASSTGVGGSATIGGSGTIGGTSGGGGTPGVGVPGGAGSGAGSTGNAPGQRGGVPATGTHLGTSTGTAIGAGGVQSPELQSAAAGQMAAAHGTSAAATPGAAAGTSGFAGDHDRSMRRLGADAIGSGQWFGDNGEAEVRGAAPNRRRREFQQDDRVTEAVSIDGQEHNLPPTVIGDGPR